MYKYIALIFLTLISCSKSDESDISTNNTLVNNEVAFVNSGKIYFENNTCKCPDASNGDKDIISGVTYTAVNNSSINDEITNGNIYLCTTLVTNMSGTSVSSIFQNFFNNNSFNSNISFWDVSNVTNMDGMFYNADTFNQDISNWNTSKVTKMLDLFRGASAFNQNISNWDTSSATSMSKMFENATSFNQNISNWCVSNITEEPENFSVNSPLLDSYKPLWGSCPE